MTPLPMNPLIDALIAVIANVDTDLPDLSDDQAQAFSEERRASEIIYRQLNAVRDWINLNLPDFECYLEDVWNEYQAGETWFEYIVRSRHTFNDMPSFGYDMYANHQDAKGVWHLGDYRRSIWVKPPEAIFSDLAAFVVQNLPSGVEVISLN